MFIFWKKNWSIIHAYKNYTNILKVYAINTCLCYTYLYSLVIRSSQSYLCLPCYLRLLHSSFRKKNKSTYKFIFTNITVYFLSCLQQAVILWRQLCIGSSKRPHALCWCFRHTHILSALRPINYWARRRCQGKQCDVITTQQQVYSYMTKEEVFIDGEHTSSHAIQCYQVEAHLFQNRGFCSMCYLQANRCWFCFYM